MKKFLSLLLTLICFSAIAEAKDLRFAQISNTKYLSSNSEQLKTAIEEINKQKDIEFVVFGGDNIAKPSQEELESFIQEIKKLKRPYYIIVGDKEVNKLKHLSKNDYANTLHKKIRGYKPETLNYSFEKKGIIFIVADGAKDVVPCPNGYYRDNVLTWLDTELSEYPDKNVIILQHFPVIPPSKRESYYTYKADDYLNVINKHKNVKAIITGHFGEDNEQVVNGVQHISSEGFPSYKIIDIIDVKSSNPTIWAQTKRFSN